MKTAIYARKSSESEDRQIQSIDDQISQLKALANQSGIVVGEIFVEAKSAKAPYCRPEFKRLMEAIDSGAVSSVLTWSINRLSRNPVDGGQIAYFLQTGRLQFIRTIDRTYRPEDNALVLSIENGMATAFIQDLRRNVNRGMESKAAKGWYPGRAPIGYVNNPLTKEIDPDPERFELVRKGWELMLTGGHTVASVYAELVTLGLTSHSRRRNVHALSRHAVYGVFTNPFYKGEFAFRSTVYSGRHIAMVTGSEFDAVQRLLGRGVGFRQRKHTFAFSGVMRCKRCGCKIVADRRVKYYPGSDRTAVYTYYHCTNGRGGCSKRGVPEHQVATLLEDIFKRIRIPQPVYEWARAESLSQAQAEIERSGSSTATIRAGLGRLQARRSRLDEMRLDSEIDSIEYQSLKSRLDTEIHELASGLEKVAREEDLITEMVQEKLVLAVEANEYPNFDTARKRGMILSLGDQHYLNLAKPTFSINPMVRQIGGIGRLESELQSQFQGAKLPANTAWSTKIRAIRNLARKQIRAADAKADALHQRSRDGGGQSISGKVAA